LENPVVILNKQLDRVKRDKIAELKLQGMDFHDRLNEIEDLEYPKPMAEFIYSNYNNFVLKHPWIGQENIRPKSIARDIYERYCTFGEYIREYGLERAEGVLLRYISDVYRVLAQTIPDILKNDAVDEMILFFEDMLKSTDSSLLAEWRRLSDLQEGLVSAEEDAVVRPVKPVINVKKLTVMIRNVAFQFLKALASRDYERLGTLLKPGEKTWREADFEAILEKYYEDHGEIALGPDARNPRNTILQDLSNPSAVPVDLIITDNEQHNDWHANLTASLLETEEEAHIEIVLENIGPIGS
jgi:hypothetical protein